MVIEIWGVCVEGAEYWVIETHYFDLMWHFSLNEKYNLQTYIRETVKKSQPLCSIKVCYKNDLNSMYLNVVKAYFKIWMNDNLQTYAQMMHTTQSGICTLIPVAVLSGDNKAANNAVSEDRASL